MKKATGILLVRKADGKVLTASRRNDFDRIGIPGGKVDPGETVKQAFFREIREETGIELSENDVELVFVSPCEGDITYEMYTYLCYAEDISPRADFTEPFEEEEGIQIRWATWDELMDEKSPFAKYNTALHEAVKSTLETNQ